jgi:hypothetical protein
VWEVGAGNRPLLPDLLDIFNPDLAGYQSRP